MTKPQHEPWRSPGEPGYDSAQLESFMRAYSYAVGLGDAGDVAAGQRLLLSHLEELRRSPDTAPAGLLDLWEIGLVRYDDQFQSRSSPAIKSPEGG